MLETNLSSLTSYSTTEYQATYSIKYLDKVFTVKGVAKVNQKMHSHALNSKMSKSNVAMTTAESESTRKIPEKLFGNRVDLSRNRNGVHFFFIEAALVKQ